MSNNKIINICTSADDNFAIYVYTLILSLIDNLNNDESAHFYILDGGISVQNLEKIKDIVKNTNHKIFFIKPDIKKYDAWFDKVPADKSHIAPATFYRLSLSSLLPNLDKVLYLDGDIILNKNISDLFNLDIDNFYLAAMPEIGKPAQNRKKRFNIKSYFNAGVMLINNKKWREDNVEERFDKFFEQNYQIITNVLDQDILNCVFQSHIKPLDKRYNYMPFNGNDKLDNKEIYIIHYSSYLAKPLKQDVGIDWHFEEFWKYFALTPYFKEDAGKYIQIMINQKINLLKNELNNKDTANQNNEKYLEYIEYRLNKVIDTLAWWIPIKKWRNNFREKFKMTGQDRTGRL